MKICSKCGRECLKEDFSGTQWKLNSHRRRCKECITFNQAKPKNVSTIGTYEGGIECWICLETGGDLRRECSCKGSGGYAHFSCLVKLAKDMCCSVDGLAPCERYYSPSLQILVDARFDKLRRAWRVCRNCDQKYRGQLRIDLANSLVTFVNGAYSNHESYWFCHEYPDKEIMQLISLDEKLQAHAEQREAHGSEENHIVLREFAEHILDKIRMLKSNKKIMTQYGHHVQCIESITYATLGDAMPDNDPKKMEYWEKGFANLKEVLPFKTPESQLADVVMNSKREAGGDTWERWEEIRSSYEINIKRRREKYGANDLRALKFELELAYNLGASTPNYHLEGERMLIDLHRRCKLILGEDHYLIKQVHVRLQAVKTRLVGIYSGGPDNSNEVFQAIQYENDTKTHCLVRPYNPHSFDQMLDYYESLHESEDSPKATQSVPSEHLVYMEGTIVICRGLTGPMDLNEKIGIVTEYNIESRTYKMIFEDDDLGEKTVHHDDTYILFDLDLTW